MSRKSILLAAAACILVVGSALPRAAEAAITTYANLTSFNAATGATSLVTFEGSSFAGLTTGSNLWYTSNAAGFSLSGATFAVPGGTHYEAIVAPAYFAPLYDRGTGNVLHADRSRSMTISFDAPVSAFALDLSTIFRSTGNVTLSFSNGDSVQASLGNPFAFHGYTTSSTFSSVTIGAEGGDYLLIDNVRFGAAAAVPEPASVALLGGALLGLGMVRRRSRGAAA